MERCIEGPGWFFTAAQFGGCEAAPAFLLLSGGNRHRLRVCLPSLFIPSGTDCSCTGQMGISVIGNPSLVRGENQAGLWPRALLPKLMESSVQGQSCPVEELSTGFPSFPAKQLFFLLHIFFSTLISLRDLIVSQVAHQVHSIGRLEKDARCIDE